MNDIKLQSPEGKPPLDENLRPLKVGDRTAPLELSDTDVKVNNLQVSGTPTFPPLDSLSMTGDIKVADGFVLDCAGDMSLDASGGNISLKSVNNASILFKVSGAPALTMYEIAGTTDDYFKIQLGTSGSTNLTTTDAAGTKAGHFTLNIDGAISMDSVDGHFIVKRDGTEFSVANSAYAGMILGYTTVGIDAVADSYNLTATMTTIDDAMKVKFVAPPSGVVEIFAQIYFDTFRRLPVLGLSDQDTTDTYQAISFPNATDVTNEHLQAHPPLSIGDTILRPHWVVTGLTPGTSYEWWLGAKTTSGAGGTLRWGGTASNQWPPFIMKAIALPTATADYAVYG